MRYNIKPILLSLFMLQIMTGFAQPEVEAPLQQQNIDTEEQTKTKLGVKFTLGNHIFVGNAFDNEKVAFGFGAGVYNIVHLNKPKTINLHWELNCNFKGSKFGKLNDTSYSKISLAYMELPVMASFQILNTKKKQPMHLLVGIQTGLLFRSSINKSYGKFGEVKTNLPFKRFDFSPVLGVRKEIGSGMSLQLAAKVSVQNIWTNTFYERSVDQTPEDDNVDYRDLTPAFRDGTHQVKNYSLELSFMF